MKDKFIILIKTILPELLVLLLKQVHIALLSGSLLEYKNIIKLLYHTHENINCPICSWNGVLFDYIDRFDARCPRCGSLERHRMQFLVLSKLASDGGLSTKSCLHIAPEPFIKQVLEKWFDKYMSTDLIMKNVNFRSDLTKVPVGNESFDFIYCSHVLEHIPNDRLALKEIYRALRINGTALLAVPVLYDKTIEYNEPNLEEFGHVRGIGPDYLDRFSEIAFQVKIISSDDFHSDKNRTRYRFFKRYRNNVPNYVILCYKK